MEYDIFLKDTGKSIKVSEGTTYETVKNQYIDDSGDPVMLAVVNGRMTELNNEVTESGELGFLSMTSRDGRRTYRRSVIFLLQKAVQELWGDTQQLRVLYSLGQGYYCKLSSVEMNAENIAMLRDKMRQIVNRNLPIAKSISKTIDAEKLFEEKGMKDKARLMHFRGSSVVHLYNIEGLSNYFYGYMAPSTGYLKYFDLEMYEDGFMLMFPHKIATEVESFESSRQLYHMLKQSREWSRMLDIGTIGALDEAIAGGRGQEIILLQESMMEENIAAIAERIAGDRTVKFIMIAGPSSSGKTTFANRLCIQLLAKGLKPHPLGLDDYYANREDCPKDENGNYDFESLEALDVAQFSEDMKCLLAGEDVQLPSFNFKTGKREYRGRSIRLGAEDVLVIEGIHGLNDHLTKDLPDESKFRIYISALTQLDIDEHNLLSTTDARLIRRIVRDARTRNTNAQATIAMWDSVHRGEEKNIFPYQDSADVYVNTALIYELPVLKVYAEPLLYQVPRDCAEYSEAKRLLKLLAYFLPLPTDGISANSLIREFIGGSCFAV